MYGLRLEALQTARTILSYPVTIDNFDNKLDIMPGASLCELWKYHERVRAILVSDLTEFGRSGARGTVTGFLCEEYSSSHIPQWTDQYIKSIGNTTNLLDLIEFNIAIARHINTVGVQWRMCVCIQPDNTRLLDSFDICCSW